ncbi:bifunctional 5,10-methylenetetrahydrofolate dehydrogenase/5,10-methenyltetrahydrofolate cyclohydrolase [Candidatus Roizmanbacteria bacterium]|nr:bifunctional 5,10-methylenetetrahydrofolate dehydrogenase/5,10-methenyltetrahydrofolate cyclohydrolase [Candidatus Roizmanbacteria bacterium]
MEIHGKKIASSFEKILKKEAKKLRKKTPLKLTVFLVGQASDQLSFVKIKAKIAKRLGIGFELIHLKDTPSFENFMHKIKEKSQDPKTTAIIIQQPLPAQLSTESIYEYIPSLKEIEGHKRKTPFFPPIGLATLTILKYIYAKSRNNSYLIIDIHKEKTLFKKLFRNKRLVLVGRGITGGRPIGKTLTQARINFINVNSQTPDPQSYYKEADVIITAVGKKIITADMIKPGVVLINVGIRREAGKLRGDYDEKEIKDIAGFYTTTPGGIGPIDVLHLYKNLIDAAKMQK